MQKLIDYIKEIKGIEPLKLEFKFKKNGVDKELKYDFICDTGLAYLANYEFSLPPFLKDKDHNITAPACGDKYEAIAYDIKVKNEELRTKEMLNNNIECKGKNNSGYIKEIHTFTDSLTDMAKDIYHANKEKGFWDKERNTGEMLMLVVSELGEAMEALRKDKKAIFIDGIDYLNTDNFKSNIKDTFEDEVADSIIRLLDMCGGLGIDIQKHIDLKLNYNKSRERLHGKEF